MGGMAGGAEQEGPCVLEGVMKDLRTQEPTHLLSPDQRLPWRQEGPGTPGMEQASEEPGSQTLAKGGRQETTEACASDGRTGRELASSLLGLLQDAAKACSQAWSPRPSSAPGSQRPQLSQGAARGWGAAGGL